MIEMEKNKQTTKPETKTIQFNDKTISINEYEASQWRYF